MRVYHGSHVQTKTINLDLCRAHTDFGQGFYVTNLLPQAQNWAARIADRNKVEPVITAYEFDETSFADRELNVLRFNDSNEAWLDFVVNNRDRSRPMHNYDIVEGPVADDDIAQRINLYIKQALSKERFLRELKFRVPTHQIAFCTLRSLQTLELVVKPKYTGLVDDEITLSLVSEYGITMEKAIDMYFTSKTYALLIKDDSELFLKTNKEIFAILIEELGLK